jgi:hypothetical protein
MLPYPAPLPDDALRITVHEPDARVSGLPEALVQDLWRRQDFSPSALATTSGEALTVLDPGALNQDGGPDFLGARVRIGEVEWAGAVEIHRTSGEWLVHRHHEDPAYDRVVLHVALVADRHTGALTRADGTALPEVVLLPHLTDSLRSLLYRFFAHPHPDFPCAPRWAEVPEGIRRPWLRLLAQERLRARLGALSDTYQTTADLEEVLWRAVMRGLGYAPNADAMEALARRVPLRRLRTLPHRLDAEALLLGAAGLLPTPSALPPGDPETSRYVEDLHDRFRRQRPAVLPMPSVQWQHARLRPANAPARRIAQAAALAAPGGLLHAEPLAAFRVALHAERPRPALRRLFTEAEPGPYWRTHTKPETRVREGSAGIGAERAEALLLNAVLPALMLQAEGEGDLALEERALDVLAAMPAAEDRVSRLYARHGPSAEGALEAQGLHHLWATRCTQGRCLSCAVGRWLLGR